MDYDIARKIGEKAVIDGAFDGLCIGSTGDACRIVSQKCNGAYIVTVLSGRRSGEESVSRLFWLTTRILKGRKPKEEQWKTESIRILRM